jgi:hypothetical protein
MRKTCLSARKLSAATVAAITCLAFFLAPLCGGVCAASSPCSQSDGDCHHSAAVNTDEAPTSLASAMVCNAGNLPAFALSVTTDWPLSTETSALAPQFLAKAAPSRETSTAQILVEDRLRPSPSLSSTTVLQI